MMVKHVAVIVGLDSVVNRVRRHTHSRIYVRIEVRHSESGKREKCDAHDEIEAASSKRKTLRQWRSK